MPERATITKSRYFTYSIYDDGYATKTPNKDPENETLLPTYQDDRGVFVWVGKKKFYVKRLVAKYFMEGTGQTLEHIDGNEENCHVNNLRFVKRDMSKDKEINTKILVDGVEYGSMAAAERFLNVSKGYLTRYFKGQLSGKALVGHKIELVE